MSVTDGQPCYQEMCSNSQHHLQWQRFCVKGLKMHSVLQENTTCHMGWHSHLTQVNTTHLNPRQAGQY